MYVEQNIPKFYSLPSNCAQSWLLLRMLPDLCSCHCHSTVSLKKRYLKNTWREPRLLCSLPRKTKYRNGLNILVRPKRESTVKKQAHTKGEVSDTPKHVRVQEQSGELGWVSSWRCWRPFLSCSGTYFSVYHWRSKLCLPLCWSHY